MVDCRRRKREQGPRLAQLCALDRERPEFHERLRREAELVRGHASKREACQNAARPALVVQGDAIDAEAYDSLVVCLFTASSTRDGVCRIEIPASSETDLARGSEIMTEKVAAIPRARLSDIVGRADDAVMKVDRALLLLPNLA